MTTAYTSLLGLALPVTGELQGTWGTTVNDSITSLLDTAVAGTTTLSSDADVTLSTTTGAANQARQAILLCSGARTALRTITAPAQSKIYTVINATTGGFSVKLVGVGPTTGVTVVAGESALVAWNGSDFIKISNTGGAASFTNVTVSGTTTLSGLTASTALALNGSKEVVSVTNTGTGNNVLSASPTLTGTIGGASMTLSSLTSGRVTYAGASGLLQDSANFTFNGTDLTVSGAVNAGSVNATTLDLTNLEVTNIKAKDGTASMTLADATGVASFSANPVFSGGTANGVLYLNGSKAATSGSALTFDGTNLGVGTGSPSSKLDVSGANATITATASSGYAAFLANAAAGQAAYTFFKVNGTETARISSNSSNLIDFALTSSATSKMRLDSTGLIVYRQDNASEGAQINLARANDNASAWAVDVYGSSAANANSLRFIDLVAGQTRMLINETGNVGIGESNPFGYKLQVAGSAAFYNGPNDGVVLATDGGSIEVYRSAGNAYIDLKSTAAEDFDARLQAVGTSGEFKLTISPGTFMQMTSTGVGINTSSPAAPLQVAGAARFGETTAGANGCLAVYNDGVNVTLEAFAGNNSATKRAIQLATYGGQVVVNGSSVGNAGLTVNNAIGVEVRDASSPFYQWYNSGAGVNLKYWRLGTSTGGALDFQTVNDAYSAASSRMSINSDGTVAINYGPVLSTSSKLQMGGDISLLNSGANTLHYNSYFTTTWKTRNAGYSGAIRFVDSEGAIQFWTSPASVAANADSNIAERMRITAAGNVGIGYYTTPIAQLELSRDSSGAEGATLALVNATSSGVNSYVSLYFVPNNGGGHDLQRAASIKSYQALAGNYADLRFLTSNSDTPQERMRITYDGNVGIGIQSPGAKLHVSGGSILLDNNQGMTFRNTANTASASFLLQNDDNFVFYNPAGAPIWSATSVASPFASYGANANNRVEVDASGNYIDFKTNGINRARISNVGNLGIGGSPQGETRVHVLGTLPSLSNVSYSYLTTAVSPSSAPGFAVGYYSYQTTAAASFTLTDMAHFYASPPAKGAGSTIINQNGFIAESTLTEGTNNFGFRGRIAAGTGRWNVYIDGSAANYFNGNTSIGTTGGDYGRTWRFVAANSQNAQSNFGFINGTSGALASVAVTKIGGTSNSYCDWTLVDNSGSPYDTFSYGSAVQFVNWDFGGSQRMRLKSNGYLGIGITDPQYALDVADVMRVGGNVSTGTSAIEVGTGRSGSGYSLIDFVGDTTYTDYGLRIIRNNGGANTSSEIKHRGTGSLYIVTQEAAEIVLQTSGSNDRLRVESDGDIVVGSSAGAEAKFWVVGESSNQRGIASKTGAVASNICYTAWNPATTGNNVFMDLGTEGTFTQRGSITYNRGTGLVAYTTTSDVRLKENIQDAAEAGATLDAIKVRQFDWKETGNHLDYGFIAQELHAVVPGAVNKPEDDAAMWSVDYSNLVPLLVKEIQSLRARVAQLEAKV